MKTQYDLSGMMQSYAYLFRNARDREHLMELIDRLRSDLDKRKIVFVDRDNKECR